jgi:hypothetical protein
MDGGGWWKFKANYRCNILCGVNTFTVDLVGRYNFLHFPQIYFEN